MSARRLKVTRIGGSARKTRKQLETLVALGLGKVGRTRVLSENPSVRGALRVVSHLVKLEEVNVKAAPARKGE